MGVTAIVGPYPTTMTRPSCTPFANGTSQDARHNTRMETARVIHPLMGNTVPGPTHEGQATIGFPSTLTERSIYSHLGTMGVTAIVGPYPTTVKRTQHGAASHYRCPPTRSRVQRNGRIVQAASRRHRDYRPNRDSSAQLSSMKTLENRPTSDLAEPVDVLRKYFESKAADTL
jgi:hypothetical protein